ARRIRRRRDVVTLVAMETRPRGWGWIGRLQPRIFDRLLVGFLLSIGLINAILDLRFAERELRFPLGAPTGMAIPFLIGLALLLVQVVPLLWRRSHPSVVLLLVAAAFAARVLLGFNPGIAGFGLLVAMYSVAAYEWGVRRLVFLVVAGMGFIAGFVVFGVTGNPRSFAITVPSLFFVAAWLIGDYLRTRRAYVAQLEERAARLRRDRHQDRRLAADAERTRIARELHDVVAHDVSVIAIQAGAARAVQATRPAAAAEALGLIETTTPAPAPSTAGCTTRNPCSPSTSAMTVPATAPIRRRRPDMGSSGCANGSRSSVVSCARGAIPPAASPSTPAYRSNQPPDGDQSP